MRFELIIFDCDGVLVDSETIANEVLACIIGRYGVSLSPGEAQRIFVGQSVDAVREIALRDLAVSLPPDWAIGYYDELLPALKQVKAIDGVADLISQLHAMNLPFCVASQGPLEKMAVTLEAANLASFFAGRIYSAKSGKAAKARAGFIPSRSAFLRRAARRLRRHRRFRDRRCRRDSGRHGSLCFLFA